MKKVHLIIVLVGLVAGACIYAAFDSSGSANSNEQTEQLKQQLADTLARLQALEASPRDPAESVKGGPAEGSIRRTTASKTKGRATAAETTAEAESEESNDPAAQIAKLINSKEARSLMKQFSSAIGNQSADWIGRQVSRYKERYGLTEAQAEEISSKLSAKMREGTNAFSQALDNEGKTVEEIMDEQRESWSDQQAEVDAIMRDTLTEEQYADYEHEQFTQRAERVQRRSERELNQLNESLDLDDSQQDQVFAILVRNSPGYDESMQIEGIDGTVSAAGTDSGESKEDAIRSVLTPEQSVDYEAYLEKPAAPRYGGFGGGFGFGR